MLDENMTNAGGKGPWKKECPEHGPQKKPPLIQPPTKGQFRFSIWYFVAAVIAMILVNSLFVRQGEETIEYSVFKEKISSGEIKRVEITPEYLYGMTATASALEAQAARTPQERTASTDVTMYRAVPVNDPELTSLLDEKNVEYFATTKREPVLLNILLSWGLPLLGLVLIWRFMFKRMGDAGSQVMTFGKNQARIVAEGETGVKFTDVAGADEAKEELIEVVDFLKTPEKYTEIGGKIPKGVLLVGSPGTGKTLLARAVAGEAGVPFFRLSGADFVEMFVGVGAARVRDLFKQARQKAPCIVFIDELDALGKARIAAVSSNDEREQTLNQVLVEMDGVDSTTGVIVRAATNRPEILDPALLRAGRFDRQIVIDKPDVLGREAILKIHSRDVKLSPSVDLHEIARATPGFVGADLANIINEGAILAVRAGRKEVTREDLMEAIEKTVAGLSRKSRLINEKEREIVAYHETGHALVAHLTPGSDPLTKISIVPRGVSALGYTLQTPAEDRFLLTREELLGKIDVLLGGRAAELIIYGDSSTGAANDLIRSTDIARKMVTEYGMSSHFTNVTLTKRPEAMLGEISAPTMSREYSESTQALIDQEINSIISERFSHVTDLLSSNKEKLQQIASRLLEQEIIDAAEFRELVGN